MNIEIKKQGKKKKYYLNHSFGEGKKVKKIRRYLGSDLTETELENLRKRAEVLIKEQIEFYKKTKDPLKQELTEKELKFLESIEPYKIINIDHLSEDDWKRFTEVFTYNTNAIEGSKVNQKEVEGILAYNKWPNEINKKDI